MTQYDVASTDDSVLDAADLGSSGKPAWYLSLSVAVDAVSAAAWIGLAAWVCSQPRPVVAGLVGGLAWALVSASRGRYRRSALGESGGPVPVIRDALQLAGLLAVVAVATGYPVVAAGAVVSIVGVATFTTLRWRLMHKHLRRLRRSGRAVRRVLVVGNPAVVDEVADQLARNTSQEYVVVGLCAVGDDDSGTGVPLMARLRALGPQTEDAPVVLRAATTVRADVVAMTSGGLTGERARRLVWATHESGLGFMEVAGFSEVAERRIEVQSVGGLTMLHLAAPTAAGMTTAVKALVDRVVAAAALILLAPVFAVLALAIRADSRGPVFYRQTRVGRAAQPFTMWKFRTMVVDADVLREQYLSANEHDGHMFKIRKDPRITRVGGLLRRCSIDELPQLLHVVQGRMSLVGPRPPLPQEVEAYTPVEMRRLRVRPGLTGLWQVSGRSDLTWDETVALDLHYVDNWSLGTDADVMIRTVRAVVEGRGAY